jgi:hypothetical protein
VLDVIGELNMLIWILAERQWSGWDCRQRRSSGFSWLERIVCSNILAGMRTSFYSFNLGELGADNKTMVIGCPHVSMAGFELSIICLSFPAGTHHPSVVSSGKSQQVKPS